MFLFVFVMRCNCGMLVGVGDVFVIGVCFQISYCYDFQKM